VELLVEAAMDDKRFSPTYYTRLNSREWKRLCDEVRKRAGYHCERCAAYLRYGLHVHHKHYKTIGRESIDDLMAVCPECHDLLDRARSGDPEAIREERRRWRDRHCKCPFQPCDGIGDTDRARMDHQMMFTCRTCARIWHQYDNDLIIYVDGRETVRPRRDDE
jgi:hypothetical protein